jgi:RAB protein geranylgeranyltransferase component A
MWWLWALGSPNQLWLRIPFLSFPFLSFPFLSFPVLSFPFSINFLLFFFSFSFSFSFFHSACSRIGKKVLHLDRNGYYGGTCPSFSFSELQNYVKSSTSFFSSFSFHFLLSIIFYFLFLKKIEPSPSPESKEAFKKDENEGKSEEISLNSSYESSIFKGFQSFTPFEGEVSEKILGRFRNYSLDLAPQLVFI